MRATALLVLVTACLSAWGDETPTVDSDFELHAQSFLANYCVDCHGVDEPEGGVLLELDAAPDVPGQIEKWSDVFQRVSDYDMPPEDALQPEPAEKKDFLQWIEAELSRIDCASLPRKPRVTVRRLNRIEYNNVIRDLLGVDVRPADEFPADDVGEGFDNIAEVLSLPPLLMEKYLDAAEQATTALAADASAWKRIFPAVDPADVDAAEPESLPSHVRQLARRAFRRPLGDEEFTRLMQLYRAGRDEGLSVARALQLVTQAVLISPQFIFRSEENAASDSEVPQPLSDYALASRLSFFLWSTIPDEELNELAAAGRLRDEGVLAAQAQRMLTDPKSRALVDNFVGQWLELRQLAKASPDPARFPTFDEALRQSMVAETSHFFEALIREDRSILDLIDADYTFVDGRLAQHYGIADVEGDEFRRVSLPDDRRGGVLTQASILTLTSNPTRTSPVKRGKWILENILGTPPPPPPPDVPQLNEGDAELLGTLRERMRQHREDPSCAVCHRKMDELGFGFENFDAVGAWRDRDGRLEIDASGVLPGELTFQTPAELRRILSAKSREFTACLTRKLLTYALGRSLALADRCVVDDIVKQVEGNEHRFSSLIAAIVTSDAFRFTD